MRELRLFAAQLRHDDEIAVEATGNTRLFYDALARKFLGVIYHTLKNNWVFEDFLNFVLAS
jgi:hypothetical protein